MSCASFRSLFNDATAVSTDLRGVETICVNLQLLHPLGTVLRGKHPHHCQSHSLEAQCPFRAFVRDLNRASQTRWVTKGRSWVSPITGLAIRKFSSPRRLVLSPSNAVWFPVSSLQGTLNILDNLQTWLQTMCECQSNSSLEIGNSIDTITIDFLASAHVCLTWTVY